jgi:hypothetical protein
VVPKVIERGGQHSRVGGRGPSTVDIAAPPPSERPRLELPLKLHQAPDLGPIRRTALSCGSGHTWRSWAVRSCSTTTSRPSSA